MNDAGSLAIAHNGLGTVWLVSPLGEPLLRIRSPAGLTVTNLTFGPDQKSLFITEAATGSVLVADVSGIGG